MCVAPNYNLVTIINILLCAHTTPNKLKYILQEYENSVLATSKYA